MITRAGTGSGAVRSTESVSSISRPRYTHTRKKMISRKKTSRRKPKAESRAPTLIPQPTRIQSAGNKPKLIDEYIGRVNSKTSSASVAHMRSPAGWIEPGQTPAFDEFTIVLKGTLHVEHKTGSFDVAAGQAVIAHSGEWIRYSTPNEGG